MQAHGTVDVSREAPAAAVRPDIDLVGLRPRLMRYARHLVGDSHAAEDLVQETLIAAFQSESGFRGQAHSDTWAIAILRHKAADWYRSAARSRTSSLDEADSGAGGEGTADAFAGVDALAADASTRPDHELERRQLSSAIDDCLGQLPARSRQVFAMHERLGMDTGEVCQRLDISAEHCRTLLHRIRLALRGRLLAQRLEP